MGVFWSLVGFIFVVIAAVTIYDLVRSHAHHGWGLAGWIAAIVIFPFIGSIVYWVRRQPSEDEVESQRLGEEALRQESSRRSVDTTSIRP